MTENFDRKKSIGEVAEELGVETHVIRFWEEQFPQIKPEIGNGGRRYYYEKQVNILRKIKHFLHDEGYTIAGLQKLLRKRKADPYKDMDIDMIAQSEQNQGFVAYEQWQDHEDGLRQEVPATNFVANISHTTNINRAILPSLTREQREETLSLMKNIIKNLGDLKMLLRS